MNFSKPASVLLSLVVFSTAVPAADGFSVAISALRPIVENPSEWGAGGQVGPVVRYDIEDNNVVGHDTIFGGGGIAAFPTIGFDGTRVAFLRWGWRYETRSDGRRYLIAGTENAPCHVSVVNKDGTDLRDLVELPGAGAGTIGRSGCGSVSGYGWDNFLAWPAGEWIYYEQAEKTGIIRRVNATTGADELVVAYAGSDPSGCACYIRRWSLSADGGYVGQQTECGGGNAVDGECFPPPEGRRSNCPSILPIDGCNAAISASGRFVANYLYVGHSACIITQWDKSTTGNDARIGRGSIFIHDVEQYLGRDLTIDNGNAEWIRWSANSDRWYCRMIFCCENTNNMGNNGSNHVIVNWIEKQAIAPADHPCEQPNCLQSGSYLRHNDAGHFWVHDPAGNPHGDRMQNEDGSWTWVPPVDGTPAPARFDGIELSPGAVKVGMGRSLQFVARAKDQYRADLATQPTLTWSISDNQDISTSGLFIARPSQGGQYTVTVSASVDGVEKTARANVWVEADVAGLAFRSYEGVPGVLPWFGAMTPVKTGVTPNFSIAVPQVTTRFDDVGVQYEGFVEAPAGGEYTFYLSCDDAAALYVHGTKIVESHYTKGELSGAVNLTAALHPIRVDWVNGCCGRELSVHWSGPGIAKQPIPDGNLFTVAGGQPTGFVALARTAMPGKEVRFTGSRVSVRSANPYKVDIMDAHGQRMRSISAVGPGSVDLRSLKPGVQVVRVMLNGESYCTTVSNAR